MSSVSRARPHGDVMHYVMEFMKFLCGFSLMLAVSLTFLYFSTSGVDTSSAFVHPFALLFV